MVKYFDKEIYTKEAWLELMADNLSGTCMQSVYSQMENEYFLPGIKAFKITEEDFENYLNDHNIINCEACGWWTYEGESVDDLCDNCHQEHRPEE